ncbi:MAG: hypothetical protein WCG08_07955 [Paludibacter sp.]
MKILHISDIEIGSIPRIEVDTPDKLALTINEKHNDTDLFLINVNYKTADITRSENAGILLLKYIRLYHFKQHCVLYSFLSKEQLIQMDIKNLIIFSEGVSFIRMPEDLDKIDFNSRIMKTTSDDLSDYFKAEFRLPDDRHFFANWWGVLQLWKVQKAVENIVSTPDIDAFESKILSSVREMNSYDGLVVRYIKKDREKDIKTFLKQLIAKKEEKFKEDNRNQDTLRSEIAELNKEKVVLDIKLEPLYQVFQEQEHDIIEKLRKLITKLPSPVQKKINEVSEKQTEIHERITTDEGLIEILNDIDTEKINIESERKRINGQIKDRIDLLTNNAAFPNSFSLDTIRQKLAGSKPTILFVDDQAEDGWASILQRMIYGEETEKFVTIVPHRDATVEAITDKILQEVETRKADLLILDLRLKGEKGHELKPEHISGFQVLKRLKDARIECPIMITSASNKLWSFNETQVLGANAYWLKEGLDDSHDLAWSCENYLRLLELIYTLCYNESYNLLYKRVLKDIKLIESSDTTFWWEKYITKNQIIDILHAAFEVFETYINSKVQRHKGAQIDNYHASQIVTIFSRVLEIIFSKLVGTTDSNTSLREKMQKGLNQLGGISYSDYNILTDLRNDSVHYLSLNFAQLQTFSVKFFELLTFSISDKTSRFIPERNTIYSAKIKKFPTDENVIILKSNLFSDDIILFIDKNENLYDEELNIGDTLKCKLQLSKDKYYANEANIDYSADIE